MHTTNESHLPKRGDRVQIPGRAEPFIVVAVDRENASVSLMQDSDFPQLPVDKAISLNPRANWDEPRSIVAAWTPRKRL
jgi:hypothetical protein